MPKGIPAPLTPELFEAACDLATDGGYLPDIADKLGIGYKTLFLWQRKDARFREAFNRARADGVHMMIESLPNEFDECVTKEDVQRVRAKADFAIKIAAARDPAMYGNNQTLRVETIDLGGTVIEARKRLICDLVPLLRDHGAEYAVLLPPSAADTQSADEPSIFD